MITLTEDSLRCLFSKKHAPYFQVLNEATFLISYHFIMARDY